MHLLSLENVAKSYPETRVFEDASIGISSGDHVAVIGRNGSGKSTLLKLIEGLEDPDDGQIIRMRGLRIAALDQDPQFDPDSTIESLVGSDRASIALADRLGLSSPAARAGTLSGGQRKRLALAVALSTDCDLLILDEPTNHLDIHTIDWLENHIRSRTEAILLVTHDRYLLDQVATRIVEVYDHTLHAHAGSYEQFLDDTATRAEHEASVEHKRRRRMRTELEWLRRSPKARTSKSKARIARVDKLVGQRRPKQAEDLKIDLPSRRIGSKVVNLHNAGKRYDDRWVLRHIEHKLQPDARIGVVGPNGAGKTTLLSLLAERIEPDEGKVVVGSTIHFGWYGQDPRPIAADTRLIDAMREHLDQVELESGLKVSGAKMLERFQFTRDQQRSTLGDLSGGERRRFELLLSLLEAPNVLLMDEPTNDLDIETLAVLEEYLDQWSGALVVSSHDRYFLDRVCSDIYSIEHDGSLRHHPTGWSGYRSTRTVVGGVSSGSAKKLRRSGPQAKRSLTYQEKKELDKLARLIPSLEARIKDIDEALGTVSGDYDRTLALSTELASTAHDLDSAETRWLELSEEQERIASET